MASAATSSSSSAATAEDADAHPWALRLLTDQPQRPLQQPWGLRFHLNQHRWLHQNPWGPRFAYAPASGSSSAPMRSALPSTPASAASSTCTGPALPSASAPEATPSPMEPALPSQQASASTSAPKGPALHSTPASEPQGGIREFQVLAKAAAENEFAAKKLLLASMGGNVHDIEKWLKILLGSSSDGLESASISLSKPSNKISGVLHLSAALGDAEICELLITHLQHDVNSLICDATPLMFAIGGKGSIDVVKLLLNKGADSNATGAFTTPLLLAVKEGLSECIKVLLFAGGNANICDMHGKFPIEIAAANGFKDCVEILFWSTFPLPGYTTWSVDGIIEQLNTEEEFFDVEEHDEIQEDKEKSNTIRMGSMNINTSNQDQTQKQPTDPGKTEKKVKGNNNFLFGHMDKIPTLLLSTCLMGIGAVHSKIIVINDTSFQFLCAGASVAVASSASLFGHTAYYKETETTSDFGYQVCSCLTYGLQMYLLVASCVIVLGFQKCQSSVIVPSAVATAVAITLTWRVPADESKMVWVWIKDKLKRRRETLRDNTPLPTTTQQ